MNQEIKEIILLILKYLGSAIIGGALTYFTFFSKAKKQEKAKIIGKNMEKRAEALEEIKKVISQLSTYERVDIVHPETGLNRPMAYNAIFENYDTFEKFYKEYSRMRKKYDQYIDGKVFYYICAGTQYLMLFNKIIYIGLEKDKEAVFTVGIYAYKEVNDWQHKVIDLINKELNSPKYRYKKKTGYTYNRKLKKMTKKVQKTDLYKNFIISMNLKDEEISLKFKNKATVELYKVKIKDGK